ncbi:MAG TPA: GGDEF domain-containing protein [Thermoleophilaceae bacterium]
MDAPIERLDETRGELAKAWLLRVVEQSSLEEIERLPTPRIARDLPELIGEIARAAAEDAPAGGGAAHGVEWAKRLAELSGRGGTIDSQLIRDVAGLQSVMVTALHKQLRTLDPGATLRAVERLTELFSSLQADAVEEVLRQRSRELEWLGTTDELTGLQNERYLQQHMHHLVGVQRRYGHPFALLLIDIDGLKRINDAYGQAAGDRTLVDVATALGESIRAVDTPIRTSDDEFCLLLPQQTASRARTLADRIATAIEAIEGPAAQTLGVTVGVVSCPQHGTDVEKLLELADTAMYRAKASGERVAEAAVPDEPEQQPQD